MSRVGVVLYEHALGRKFHKITTSLRTVQYGFPLALEFLTLLSHQPHVPAEEDPPETISLEIPDVTLFKELQEGTAKIASAMKLSRKRKASADTTAMQIDDDELSGSDLDG